MNAIGTPWNALGTFASSSLSLIPDIKNKARVKPIPADKKLFTAKQIDFNLLEERQNADLQLQTFCYPETLLQSKHAHLFIEGFLRTQTIENTREIRYACLIRKLAAEENEDNIALIKDHKPVLGVVYVPVKDIMYYADDNGSFKKENNQTTKLESKNNFDSLEKLRIGASKSHFNEETKKYIESLNKDYELVNAGSSLKLCLVAENKADIYPRLCPTMEWDTAAAHAVVLGAGGHVKQHASDDELEYNKENILNPWFVVNTFTK